MFVEQGKNLQKKKTFRFSTPAFSAWSQRIQNLEKEYPGLYSSSFLDEQKDLIANRDSSLSQLLTDYENARTSVREKSGEDVFISFNEDKISAITTAPSRTVIQEKGKFEEKLKRGAECIQNILRLQVLAKKFNFWGGEKRGGEQGEKERCIVNKTKKLKVSQESSIEKKNLKMIELSEWGDKLEQWKATLEDDTSQGSFLGLPISDTELDQWVADQYVKAPLFQRKSPEEQKWMKELDEKLVEYLKSKKPDLDEDKWRSFNDACNEVFHPHKIEHYSLNDFSKSLFRAALWQSAERLHDVEKSVHKLQGLYNDTSDDDVKIIRRMYELYPDSHLPSLVALQLQITDPLFAARLVDETRARLEKQLVQRAIKDIVRDFELPYLKQQKDALQQQLDIMCFFVFFVLFELFGIDCSLRQKLSNIDAEIASYDEELPSLEKVLDEYLPEKLWSKNPSDVKEAILQYSAGKGSLDDVVDAVKKTLAPSPESANLTSSDILQMSIRYHNAKHENLDFWNLQEFISTITKIVTCLTNFSNSKQYIDQNLTSDNLLDLSRHMRKRLQGHGIDPLLINLVNILIEDEKISELGRVLGDFSQIMKIYRGEIEGVIASAQELTEDEFRLIMDTLTKANPGKKITMARTVEPGLLAGFVVKAGVQKFDFSLLTHIEKSRQAMQV
ncbi:ATP synthase F1, delta subunit [Reticulomyxa filosa]|uniref:ATP synthase F1, delta subunit n=1 Tax=Reticulomyxa filosa TaxID=46433 RepID=X6N116_RETFI|nr:ATP synthase F1, delta subunit [Reticulomyxa filosa]|eukprot:ETO19608.1 ATP synthase F1, delta subunit [Reticulomyxa filosa]